jgi:hypothetical protein
VNYSTLSQAEGWGIVYMVGLFLFGATAFVVNAIIQWLFNKKDHQHIAGVVALGIYIVLFFWGR